MTNAIAAVVGGIASLVVALSNLDVLDLDDERVEEVIESSMDNLPAANPPEVVAERRTLKFEKRHRNPHCASAKNINWTWKALDGWEMDPGSLHIEHHNSSKSDYYGYEFPSNRELVAQGRIANRGKCVKVFGTTVARDARGALSVPYRRIRRQPDQQIPAHGIDRRKPRGVHWFPK